MYLLFPAIIIRLATMDFCSFGQNLKVNTAKTTTYDNLNSKLLVSFFQA